MITPVMPTYGRWDVAVRTRRRLLSLRRPTAASSSTSPAASPSPRWAIATRTDRGAHQAGGRSCGTPRTCSASRRRRSWPSGWSRTASPTPCSSTIRAPRPSNAAIKIARKYQCTAASPSATGSSAATARSTAARWRRSPPPGNEKYLNGFGPLVDGFDHVAVQQSQRDARRDRRTRPPAILVEPVQGEGGMRAPSTRISEGPARDLRRIRPAAVLSTRCNAAWAAPASCSRMNGPA